MRHALAAMAFSVLAAGCSHSEEQPLPSDIIAAVPQTEAWTFPKLHRPVHVIRTESNVPHVYAADRHDLGYVYGFVLARDRYFVIDLARRLGQGTIAELLGQNALSNDVMARGTGRAYVTDQIVKSLTPELGEYFDALAAGINEYIAQVVAENELTEPPTELKLGKTLLAKGYAELMKPFTRRDVAAIVAVVLYESSYETGDVGRAASAAALPGLFKGAPLGDLRLAGAKQDIWQSIAPVFALSSAPGLGNVGKSGPAHGGLGKPVPPELLQRMSARYEILQRQLNRDREAGFGSNAWAVSAAGTADGSALLAGDGHLSLAVPSILYQIGLDTDVLGRGDLHQLGLTIAGFPVMPIGTNGNVAWSQTQLGEDITDWYREEIQLDANGRPQASRFQGGWKPLTASDEKYTVAEVAAFGSKGHTELWPRFTTFDGRWIADVEGRAAKPDEKLAPGETLLNLQGQLVVPKDMDNDGVVTAVSFYYAGFDAGAVIAATDAFGRAADVHQFREGMRSLVAYSQNFAVADSGGHIMYSSYQAVPCRKYLKRNADGSWADGADPSLLLDGTTYGAFHIPISGVKVDETQGNDPYRCVVPFDAVPQIIDPPSGYVFTANNDPGGMSFDQSLTNDGYYLGGPWDRGWRANRIATELKKVAATKTATIVAMADIQGNKISSLGEYLLADLLPSLEYAQKLGAAPTSDSDQRIAALYQAHQKAIDEAYARLKAWRDAGWHASSGVDTFYEHPDAAAKKNAVATMIFNAWLPRVMHGVFDDEQLPDLFADGNEGRIQTLVRMLRGRGAQNPGKLASWNAATGESAFFDVLATPEVETSHEDVVAALVGALDFLSGPPDAMEKGKGGFGTADMSAWIWGLRHQVRFDSLLGDYLPADSMFKGIVSQFEINTTVLPLADGIAPNDPRAGIPWFPRGGDNWGIDAANPGLGGSDFRYGAGPVMRMVVQLSSGGIVGQNIIPGGQSALTTSKYFADQAGLWLGNKTLPMRFYPADVAAAAIGHEVYSPH